MIILSRVYQERTPIDYAYGAVSILLNFVYLKWHQASIAKPAMAAPTRPAQLLLKQIRKVADAVIPGSRLTSMQ